MSTSWTEKDDDQLLEWVEKGRKKGWSLRYLFLSIGQKLQRTPEECFQRWNLLNDQRKWEQIENKLVQLEQIIEDQQAQIDKMKKDLQFYELMLLEEYHLLLRILGEDQKMIRIHQV